MEHREDRHMPGLAQVQPYGQGAHKPEKVPAQRDIDGQVEVFSGSSGGSGQCWPAA
jgi:hypothetical protein